MVVGKVLLLLFNTTRAHNLRAPKHGSRYRYGRRRGRFVLRILFNTTRMVRTPKQKHERRIKCEVRPRCGRSFSCARDGAHDFGNNSLVRQT